MADVQEQSMLHTVYIQCILSRRSMTIDVAIEMFKRAYKELKLQDVSYIPENLVDIERRALRTQFLPFVEQVSELLSPFGMKVKIARDDKDGKEFVALCNMEANKLAELATDLTPLEITYFRNVVEAIMTSYPANSIGKNQALALTNTLKANMTNVTAQQLLSALVSRQWLVSSKRGRLTLSPRALMELDQYLHETYDEFVVQCELCSKMLTQGKRCAADNCNAHYHNICYAHILERGDASRCRTCRASFHDTPPLEVGEKSVPEREDEYRRVNRKRPRTSRGRLDDEGEEDELDEELGGDPMEGESELFSQATQSQSQNQSLGGPARSVQPSRVFDSIADEDEEAPRRRRR